MKTISKIMTEVKFLPKKDAAKISTKDFSCRLYPAESLKKNFATFKKTLPTGLSDSVLTLLEEKFEKTKKGYKSSATATLSIAFDSGGEMLFFFTPKEIDIFKLQTALRKNFSSVFVREKNEAIRFDLCALNNKKQSELIARSLVILAKTSEWHTPVYGKKKEELSKSKPFEKTIELVSPLDARAHKTIVLESNAQAEAINLTRTLASLPSNELNPDSYLKIIQERKKERKYSVEYFDYKKLEAMGAGSFMAVISGSMDKRGGIAHLSFKPKGKAKKKLILVGKGLCFDTGGHNIKTGDYMLGMHRDMAGSATALATFEALIDMKAPYELHCFLALAENMVSYESYRPNDIVIAMDGTSIEVVNTDAEGRMVLADTLALARKQKGNLCIDFATLTGSAVRAIGTRRCAVFSNKEKLLKAGYEAGVRSGERVWGFPIGDDYAESLESEFADTLQCTLKTPGDHIFAATFLSRFIGDETPWIHCDLSAEHNAGGLGLIPTDVTAFGVRWAIELAKNYLQ